MLRDGEPCSHKGCLNHISHPCEGCGRIAGKYTLEFAVESYKFGFSVTYDGDNHKIKYGTNCNCCGKYFEADELGVYCQNCIRVKRGKRALINPVDFKMEYDYKWI